MDGPINQRAALSLMKTDPPSSTEGGWIQSWLLAIVFLAATAAYTYWYTK